MIITKKDRKSDLNIILILVIMHVALIVIVQYFSLYDKLESFGVDIRGNPTYISFYSAFIGAMVMVLIFKDKLKIVRTQNEYHLLYYLFFIAAIIWTVLIVFF